MTLLKCRAAAGRGFLGEFLESSRIQRQLRSAQTLVVVDCCASTQPTVGKKNNTQRPKGLCVLWRQGKGYGELSVDRRLLLS